MRFLRVKCANHQGLHGPPHPLPRAGKRKQIAHFRTAVDFVYGKHERRSSGTAPKIHFNTLSLLDVPERNLLLRNRTSYQPIMQRSLRA